MEQKSIEQQWDELERALRPTTGGDPSRSKTTQPELPGHTFAQLPHDRAAGPQLFHVRLDDLRIDPAQPRQYLPPDLREQLATGQYDPRSTLKQLADRVAQGEAEASAYQHSVEELGESIASVGLLQPLLVRSDPDTPSRHIIVDGERRFWALHWLTSTGRRNDDDTVPVLGVTAGTTAHTLRCIQWSVNAQREAVPVVDFAELVSTVYDAAVSLAENDRRAACAEIGLAWDEHWNSNPRALATRLASARIAELTGQRLADSSLARYVYVAIKLAPQVKQMARAHRFGLNQLLQLARFGGEQQIERAVSLATPDAPNSASLKTSAAGPDTRAPSNLLRLMARVHAAARPPALTHLARLKPDERRQLLDSVRQTESSLAQIRQQLESALEQA